MQALEKGVGQLISVITALMCIVYYEITTTSLAMVLLNILNYGSIKFITYDEPS